MTADEIKAKKVTSAYFSASTDNTRLLQRMRVLFQKIIRENRQ